MNENRVVPFRQEDEIDDPLTEIRTGARRLITRAVEIEFDTFLASNADLALPDGRQRVVRHGHDPVRTVQTGIGPVDVQKPKARDRGAPEAGERIRFTSAILPKWARRTKSLDALLPALYLRGISAGDFQEVLTALLGKDAPNLSPAVIARLKGEWELSSSPVEEITQPGAKQSRPSRTAHFGGGQRVKSTKTRCAPGAATRRPEPVEGPVPRVRLLLGRDTREPRMLDNRLTTCRGLRTGRAPPARRKANVDARGCGARTHID